MRPALTALACALLAASTASPSVAQTQRQRGDESWGQPGVSFLQYRTDAVECAYKVGQDAPVEFPEVDLIFPDNMPTPDDATAAMWNAIDQEKARFSRPWREISSQLQGPLAKCLGERGYRRFRLTKDQVKTLRDLRSGGKARNVYLWNLAVDPQIQRQQAMRR